MKTDPIVQIFEDMGVEAYESFNSNFLTLSKGMHFLTQLVLQDLPKDAKILCIGVGTGADIIDLAQANPGWTFTGIDPAATMLEGCKQKLAAAGLSDRCELFHGYLADFKSSEKFDAALCFFVFHFIPTAERRKIYADTQNLLKDRGRFVHAEISFDPNAEDFSSHLENWKALHRHAGATEEKLELMPDTLTKQLSALSPNATTQLIKDSGFNNPTHFFQSFMIHAWHSQKQE